MYRLDALLLPLVGMLLAEERMLRVEREEVEEELGVGVAAACTPLTLSDTV